MQPAPDPGISGITTSPDLVEQLNLRRWLMDCSISVLISKKNLNGYF